METIEQIKARQQKELEKAERLIELAEQLSFIPGIEIQYATGKLYQFECVTAEVTDLPALAKFIEEEAAPVYEVVAKNARLRGFYSEPPVETDGFRQWEQAGGGVIRGEARRVVVSHSAPTYGMALRLWDVEFFLREPFPCRIRVRIPLTAKSYELIPRAKRGAQGFISDWERLPTPFPQSHYVSEDKQRIRLEYLLSMDEFRTYVLDGQEKA